MITDLHLTTGILGKLNSVNSESPLVMVLGIRPDIIRASLIINRLREELGSKFKLIWSGQHYSENLKDIFFNELQVSPPDIELEIKGDSDSELVSQMISKLSVTLREINPCAIIFLGDTNTVTGVIAAGQLNIPVVHIEGCMRSYDWRMPEEKYRTIADHSSDLIYAYLEEYKSQGLAEGIPNDNIVVTGNPIVDVLEKYFIKSKKRFSEIAFKELLATKYGLSVQERFLVMTCHRRENVDNEHNLTNIINLADRLDYKIIFPAGYRTQKKINEFGIQIPSSVVMVDPIGYMELLEIMQRSGGVLTDSGTVVEECAILGVPSIQMRTSTERPQVYDVGASVKFDPRFTNQINTTISKFKNLSANSWKHPFGNGKASKFIADDLLNRYKAGSFFGHQPEKFRPFSDRSFS